MEAKAVQVVPKQSPFQTQGQLSPAGWSRLAAACHRRQGQQVGGKGREEVGRTQTVRTPGVRRGSQEAATAPHTKRASRAQALQPSDLGVSTWPSQQEASEPPSFPLSPTLHLLTSQSPPQPVLRIAPCGAPSGTFKQ